MKERKYSWTARFCGAFLLFGLLAAGLSRLSAGFADFWSRAVIANCVQGISRLTGRFPFPLLEIAAGAAALTLAALALHALIQRRIRPLALTSGLLLTAILTGYLSLWYPLYFAPSSRPYAVEEEADAAGILALSKALIADLATLDTAALEPAEMPEMATRALVEAGETPFEAAGVRAKAARYPEWMKALRLAGFFAPWTSEALYSPLLPLAAQPFTAAHELAHLLGVADEGQANIAAFRACVRAGGALERSAYLHALACALPRLRRLDYAAWEGCVAALDVRSMMDLRAMGGLTGGTANTAPGRVTCLLGVDGAVSNYDLLVDYLVEKALAPSD